MTRSKSRQLENATPSEEKHVRNLKTQDRAMFGVLSGRGPAVDDVDVHDVGLHGAPGDHSARMAKHRA